MSFFRWCMRYGAAILFVITGVQLLIGLIGAVHLFQVSNAGGSGYEIGSTSDRPLQFLVLLQTLMNAFTTAALPFFGALVIHRLDRRADPRQAEPFE